MRESAALSVFVENNAIVINIVSVFSILYRFLREMLQYFFLSNSFWLMCLSFTASHIITTVLCLDLHVSGIVTLNSLFHY